MMSSVDGRLIFLFVLKLKIITYLYLNIYLHLFVMQIYVNAIYAETGINPRDVEKETTGHRGLDILDCKQMLTEAGFTNIFHISQA